jgi:tetratricopeptide (TPR) repeat protein
MTRDQLDRFTHSFVFACCIALILAGVLGLLGGCSTLGGLDKPDANGDAAAALAQAQELRHLGRASQAAAVAQKALLTVAPNNVLLQGELARDLIESGDYNRALDIVADAFDPAAPDAKLEMVGAVALDLLGRHGDAARAYAEALKIAPNDPSILKNMEIGQRMAADENALKNKKVAATPMPRKLSHRASDVPIEPKIAPKAFAAPDAPAPNFRDRFVPGWQPGEHLL